MKILIILFLMFLTSHVSADDYENYKLRWTPPTGFENNEALSVEDDLSVYKIYYGPTREQVRENSVIIDPLLTKFSLSGLNRSVIEQSSIIYLAMTAISKSGVESKLSEIVFFLP